MPTLLPAAIRIVRCCPAFRSEALQALPNAPLHALLFGAEHLWHRRMDGRCESGCRQLQLPVLATGFSVGRAPTLADAQFYVAISIGADLRGTARQRSRAIYA